MLCSNSALAFYAVLYIYMYIDCARRSRFIWFVLLTNPNTHPHRAVRAVFNGIAAASNNIKKRTILYIYKQTNTKQKQPTKKKQHKQPTNNRRAFYIYIRACRACVCGAMLYAWLCCYVCSRGAVFAPAHHHKVQVGHYLYSDQAPSS